MAAFETRESPGPIQRWITEGDKRVDVGFFNPYPVQLAGPVAGLPKDAFNRLQISEPVTIFDSQSQYDEVPLLFETQLTGGATETHQANESAVDLTVTTASGDKATRQTRQYFRYQPGKSQLTLTTFAMGSGQANTVQRVGYFDDENGFYLKETNGNVSIVKRSNITGSMVETEVAQTAWNVDPMDGTGPSQMTLDVTRSQIFFTTAEWLGTGTVTLGFFIDGYPRAIHKFHHANRSGNTTTYTTTHNLPVRYEVENTGAAAASLTLKTICCSVISEGGVENDRGYPFCASNGINKVTTSTRRPILSVRPQATYNSITNRAQILINTADVLAVSNSAYFEVVYNGTLTGASFSAVNASSTAEYDTSATAISGGIAINAFFVPAGAINRQGPQSGQASLQSKLPLTLDIDGANPINVSVVATAFSATASCVASLFWNEFR